MNKQTDLTFHFFLRYQNSTDLCKCLMNELIKTNSRILTLEEKSSTKLLLHGGGRYDMKTITSITIKLPLSNSVVLVNV